MKIISAETSAQIEAVRCLFREYEAFLAVDLGFQCFEEELADLPGKYGPPDGMLLLAWDGMDAAGCGALRKLSDGICEMKRLYIRPHFRGLGLGIALARRLINEAARMGYSTMLLDTLDRLKTAIRIYKALGFRRTEPYYPNPLEGVVYWRLDLTGQQR